MSRDVRLYLDDIIDSCERIEGYTRGMTSEDFFADRRTRDAVIANLTTIGEAAKQLPADIKAMAPSVDWKRIAGFRDRIVHQYFKTDDTIVWTIVEAWIAPLLAAAKAVLGQIGD